VAVALCDGQVLQAQAVDSVQAGEAFLAAITEKYSADIGQVSPESTMATQSNFVVIPFTKADEGFKAGRPMECASAKAAMTRARLIVDDKKFSGAVAMKNSGNPSTGEFKDLEILGKFGEMPEDLGEM
jgi:hypothetical protein